MLRLSCPVCGSGHVKPKRVVHRRAENWHLDQCSCGFIYCRDPRADTKDALTVTAPRARHFQIARLLLTTLPEGARVTEIGAGSGALAGLLRPHFDYCGFEPGGGNPSLNIRQGYFTPMRLAEAVVLDNVIEHVHDPVDLLVQAVAGLGNDGLLIVVVPNRRDVRQLSPAWRRTRHWIPPDHINYFGATDLRRIFDRLGLEMRPFGLRALTLPRDLRFLPRAFAEHAGLSIFGHNVVGVRRQSAASEIITHR
jgi:hypothetical protein